MRNLSSKVALVVAVMATAVMPVASQSPPAQKPSFEVATVKPNTADDQRVSFETQPGGRIVATNLTLKSLIVLAYRLPGSRISGGPNWVSTERWNIEAKAEEGS